MNYIVFTSIVLALMVYCAWRDRQRDAERRAERAELAAEREQWRIERRDLNNRIQIPEAAPFMEDAERPGDGEDDLPVLPASTVDEAALERAREELAEVGYDEGPVA